VTLAILVNGSRPPDLGHAVAANDRGLHYGDGVFETALLQQGSVRFLDAHLERLLSGCERLSIEPPNLAVLRDEISTVTTSLRSGVLKLIVTRGVAQTRGYRPEVPATPTRIVALYAAPNDTEPHAPVQLRWCDTRLGRNARLAGIKHLNRLEHVLAQAEWRESAVAEGLMLDTEGELVCGTASNVFIVREGTLLTPDLRFCGVRGVVRAQVLRAARAMQLSVSEEPLWPDDLLNAQEVFVTNAVRGIRSVGQLDLARWTHFTMAKRLREALGL
jgi:4-amino-4-deoxychorismate lyase